MKIAVNTRLLLPGKMDGIGWFTKEIFERIAANHPDHQFYFLFDSAPHSDLTFPENVTVINVFPPARRPWLFKIWFNRAIPRVLKKIGADVFISPDGYLSLTTNLPQIGVIHDLNFEHYPEDLPPKYAQFYTKYFRKYAHKAARIITVSEYSKADIVKTYSVDEDKISVVYNGVNEQFGSLNAKRLNLETWTDGEEYFIFVGSLHARKNIVRMLQAFEKFKTQTGSKVKFLLVGSKLFDDQQLENLLEKTPFRLDIVLTGRLEVEELNAAIRMAMAMVYVPYFEGFGIPILEAWACGTALITSTVTSMPEVAGEAALLADPFDVESIYSAMMKMFTEPELRSNLVNLGSERLKMFSWDKSAEEIWQCILHTLQQTEGNGQA